MKDGLDTYFVFQRRRNLKQWIFGLLFLVILIGGWRWPLLGYFIPLCMLAGMGIGLLRGRQWCDWLCPRGSFYDAMTSQISPRKTIPGFFKGLPLRLAMMALMMTMVMVQVVRLWPDYRAIGAFFIMLLTVTTVVGILLMLAIHPRTWCCFCPIGSMGNWLGRNRYPLFIDSANCTECKRCYEVCPIQVAPFKFRKTGMETVRDGDCLKCGLCVQACPKGALKWKED